MSGNASLKSLEDYHPTLTPDAVESGQPTVSPMASQATSGGSQRLDDSGTTREQVVLVHELDPWKRRYR